MSAFVYQKARSADFILSEANGQRSRANVVISAGSGVLEAGMLLAILTAANAATATAAAGNVGNGVFGPVTVDSQAITGTYTVRITEAAANGGAFILYDPSENPVGDGLVGSAFTGGGLAFTVADGATDFDVGDNWSIAVQAGLGEYVPYDDDGANDGRRTVSGVLYAGVDASTRDVQAVAVVRDAEVAAALLIGLDAPARADMEAAGVLVRD